MRFCEFAKKVQEEAARLCGEAYEVGIQEVRKNNGVTRTGLFLRKEGETVGAVVYLDTYYRCWGRGAGEAPIGDVARLVCKAFSDSGREELVAREFRDFGSLRHRIVYRLVSRERNEELLKEVPWVPFCDLAVVFCLAGKEDGIGRLTAMIGNEWAGKWGLGLKELYGLAAENTPRLFPARIKSMREVMEGIAREHLGEAYREEVVEELFSAPVVSPLYVISNEAGNWGAATVLYQGVLKGFSDQVGKDLILLPSSVHEFLIIPWEERLDMGELRDLVIHVNQSEVSEEEILSDQVYRYRRETDRIEEVFQGPGARDSAQAMEAENKEKDFI